MRVLRSFRLRLRSVFRGRRVEQDLEEELRIHLDREIERNSARGVPPVEARAAALRAFGNVAMIQEQVRDTWRTRWLEDVSRDLRVASRILRRSPGFSVAIALTLAFGIGANTALFSICNTLLLKPLPYANADRLVMLWEQLPGLPRVAVAPANFIDWRRDARSFSQVAGINPFPTFVLSGSGEAARLNGAAVSWDFFSLLGVQIDLGRSFVREDDQPGRNRVAILSHGTWLTRFGERRDIVGTELSMNDLKYVVIGVLPEQFEFTAQASDFQGRNQFDVWIPLGLNATPARGTHPLRVFARLADGATLAQAQAEMDVIAANLARAYPADNTNRGIGVIPLREQLTAGVRPMLLTLFGAVGFVLLIACANVASLLLSRGTGRAMEMSVRMAMGAGFRRIAQQLLIESVLLAVVAGGLGLAVAFASIRIALPYLPAELSRANHVTVDAQVLLFTLVTSVGTGVLFGLAPLFQARRLDANRVLTHGPRTSAGSVTRLRAALVVAQIAITCILLIGAGLMARSLSTLLNVPTGFHTDHLLTARLTLPRGRFPDAAHVGAIQAQLVSRLRQTPGVQSAGAAAYLPFSGDDNGWSFFIDGRPPLPTGVFNMSNYRPVTAGYFGTIGVPLVRGRDFSDADDEKRSFVVVINETMARMYFEGENPIGQRIRFGGPTWRTVIGIVGDLRHYSLDQDVRPEMYVPFSQAPQPEGVAAIVIRTPIDAAAMTVTLRRTIGAIDPGLPLDRIQTMEQLVSATAAQPRFRTLLLTALALLALTMACVAIYGVTNYSVRQRTRELGIYMAIGASSRDVLRLVLRQSATLIVVGLSVGLLASAALGRVLAQFLFGVTPLDVLTFLIVSLLLAFVAFVATLIPARGATRLDPVVALRYE
jgi:predicted permease